MLQRLVLHLVKYCLQRCVACEMEGQQQGATHVTTRTLKRHANPGEYVTRDGWRVYRSVDTGRWVIVNPETGGDFDSADTLREIRDLYA